MNVKNWQDNTELVLSHKRYAQSVDISMPIHVTYYTCEFINIHSLYLQNSIPGYKCININTILTVLIKL